jgi:hypothetical protein
LSVVVESEAAVFCWEGILDVDSEASAFLSPKMGFQEKAKK